MRGRSTSRRTVAVALALLATVCGVATAVLLRRDAPESLPQIADRPAERSPHRTVAPQPEAKLESSKFAPTDAAAARFRLVVVDAATSSPIEGATVVLSADASSADVGVSTRTGADGAASLSKSPPCEGRASAPGYADATFAIAHDAAPPQTVALRRGRAVVVECVDRAGAPVDRCVASLGEPLREKTRAATGPAGIRIATAGPFKGDSASGLDGVVRISDVADGSYALYVEHPYKIRAPETMTNRVVVAGGDVVVRAVLDDLYGVVLRLDPSRFSSLCSAPRIAGDGFEVRAEKLAVAWRNRMRDRYGDDVVAYATARRPDADGAPDSFAVRGFSALEGWCRVTAPLRVVDDSTGIAEPQVEVEDPRYKPSWIIVRALQPDGGELKGVPFEIAAESPKGGLHLVGRSGDRTAAPPGKYHIEFSDASGVKGYFGRKSIRLDPGAVETVELQAERRIGRVRFAAKRTDLDLKRGVAMTVDGGRENRFRFPTDPFFFAPCDANVDVAMIAARRTDAGSEEALRARIVPDAWRADADGAPVLDLHLSKARTP